MNPFDPRRPATVPRDPCCGDDDPTILLTRGDTLLLDFVVRGQPPGFLTRRLPRSQLVPADVTGWSVWFTVKLCESDPDSAALYQAAVGTGITVVNARLGQCELNVPPATTRLLTVPKMRYDIQVKDLSGNVFTIRRGDLVLTDDVTFATA